MIMKASKKIALAVSVLITILLVFGSFCVYADAATDYKYGRSTLEKMNNSSALIYVYEKIGGGCSSETETEIKLTDSNKKITVSELSTVVKAFVSDHPEYFWISGAYGYTYYSDNTVASVTMKYSLQGNALKNAKKALEDAIEQMLAGLDGKSDYDKAKLLHDRLCVKVDYEFTENDQTAYGALVEGRAVCAGYARAYQLLLHRAGIDSWTVSGTSNSPSSGQSVAHAWNTVKIDGKWYYTDVTWDDQYKSTDSGADEYDIYYAYFNVTSAQIKEDHVLDAEYFAKYVPDCTATAANYFVKNGGSISSFNNDTVADRLKENALKARFYVTGNVSGFSSAFMSGASGVAKKIGVVGAYSYGYSVLGREVILYIDGKVGHSYTALVKKVSPTCTESGMEAHYRCNDCTAYFDIDKKQTTKTALTIKALGHDWAAADCTTPKTCKRSGCNKTSGAPLGHSPSDWLIDGEEHYKKCTVKGCGAEITNTRAKHVYTYTSLESTHYAECVCTHKLAQEAHYDANNDSKCDKCGYNITPPVTDPPVTDPPDTKPSVPDPSGTAAADTGADTSRESGKATDDGDGTAKNYPAESEAKSSHGSVTTEKSAEDGNADKSSGEGYIIYAVIGVVAVAVIAIICICSKKKK